MATKPTSADVARLAGVSRTTVSFVLNNSPHVHISEETRQRVIAAALELDYHPNVVARSLARQQTRTVAIVLCESPDQLSADAFLPAVLRGITSITGPEGFKLLVETVDDVSRPDAYVNLVRGAQIDGIILSGPRSDDHQLPRLRSENFPVVLMGQLPDSDLPFADVDNVGAARMAVEHLIGLGHTRIGCITNAPPEYTSSADRLLGYRTALEAHDFSFDDTLVRQGGSWNRGFEAMQSLLALPGRPSAVFVANDVVALGAIQAAKSAGLRIPHDLALVGFDDVPVAEHVVPPLTTVRLPARELGATAARMLLRIVETSDRPDSVLLKTRLVVRESCGACLGDARPVEPTY